METPELIEQTRFFLERIHRLKRDDLPLLREVIREHNTLYHRDESPVISDYEYDTLFHALARLESDTGDFDPDSPTTRLRVLLDSQFQKVRHLYPMISLDNTYNIEEIRDFETRIRNRLKTEKLAIPPFFSYYLQPKFDGLGLAIIYEYGILTRVVTRGNGVEGENVTANAHEVESIPAEISALSAVPRLEVRGEIVMPHDVFLRVNRERLELGEKVFANPRNSASGSLRQLDPLVTRGRGLLFLAYSVPEIEQGIFSQKIISYRTLMEYLETWGFTTGNLPDPYIEGMEALLQVIDRENTPATRTQFPYDTDGLVIKCDDISLWQKLGTTEHHPRYATAYKFPPTEARTKVLSIEHSVGRTGIVTPVANLEPVNIGGVIVRRATLHNYDELEKKDIREGDMVYVVRAGEVIPEIIASIPESRNGDEIIVYRPEKCPICQTLLAQEMGKVAIFCPNHHCPAQIQGRFEVFVGKTALDIDGLGEKQIELFLEKGWLTDFASVFHLLEHEDEILALEGYKEKSIQNLRDSLERARHTTLDRVFVGLGIPNVGKKTAKILARFVTDFSREKENNMLDTLFSLDQETLESLRDIGAETAESILVFLRDNKKEISTLFGELSFDFSASSSGEVKKLGGKSFCVTGSFDTLSRDEIHALIEKNGGEVRTAVSAKLDFLIVGENAGSKKMKAESLGVAILSLEDFLGLL